MAALFSTDLSQETEHLVIPQGTFTFNFPNYGLFNRNPLCTLDLWGDISPYGVVYMGQFSRHKMTCLQGCEHDVQES